MLTVNTHEAKTKLSQLLAKVEHDHEKVVICRNGVPVAEMIPWESVKDPLLQSEKLSGVVFNEDPSLPLDNDEWPGEAR